MRELKAYYVKWIDHASYKSGEWNSAADLMKLKPITCHSVGFLINDQPEFITLASHVHEDEGDGDQTIARELIREMVEIKVPNVVQFDG